MARLNPGTGTHQGCGAVLQKIGQADGGDRLTVAAQCSSIRPLCVPMLWILAAMEPKQLEITSADLDLDLDSHLPNSPPSNSASRASRHDLLLLEKKVKHFEEAKKKTERFHEHLKQQFLKEQERKMARWKKASERFEKSLEVFSRRSGKSSVPSADRLSASEVTSLEQAAATDGEETKRHV
ncbi:uncharacterized protein C5orf52 homolog [Phalacrocorax aristotelis]|uniref:uncharacterized protein C5orf52 homolog n=1 Tax=Phalacrocorax aristotelis TaxID=126867 RepID=UPI003F4C318D